MTSAFREVSTYLDDLGLLRKGCVFRAAEPEPEPEEEELVLDEESQAELALLAAMGLPTGFGGAPKARRRAAAPAPPPDPDPLPAPPKYWAQRYRYFSRFDAGCQLDGEMWFSVTPEVLAARQAAALGRPRLSVDAFAGCGGNALALARARGGGGAHVLCCDLSRKRLRLSLRNAAVYGVAARVDCVQADWPALAAALARAAARRAAGGRGPLAPDAVFLSPPWGGPAYAQSAAFDLAAPLVGAADGRELLRGALAIAPRAALFMPRNADSQQLLALARGAGAARATLENGVLNGKLKAKTLYATAEERGGAAEAMAEAAAETREGGAELAADDEE